MNSRLRTRWTVETYGKTENAGQLISTLHFDRLAQLNDHFGRHEAHRFVVHPPTAVHSEDLCALDELRRNGVDIKRL